MCGHLLLALLALAPLQAGVGGRPDVVLTWNNTALEIIRRDNTPPPVAARNLAIMHVAMYDAISAVAGSHTPYRVEIVPLPGTSPEAAAASAAHRVLFTLYPTRRALLDQALADALAPIPDGEGKRTGSHLGRWVAEQVLAWRTHDRSDERTFYAPAAAPGIWERTPPDYAQPVLPHWARVTPFAMTDTNRPRMKAPPGLTDPAYTAAFREVKELGRRDSTTRTREQTEIARFWADGAGTCTPPGHWNQIAQTVARERGMNLADNARLFALLNMALADAGIHCWECKYKMSYWRPVTAIRRADQDGNPDTEADPAWTPLLDTPPFPSYVSGHSSFSGAAAAVLADVFGDRTRFRTTSESLPGVIRSFDSFWAAAEEAGMSRIYGGIHWQFDNRDGLEIGKEIGKLVCREQLRARAP